MLRSVTINLTAGYRIVLYPEGGAQVEYFQDGQWYVHHDDDMADASLRRWIDRALHLLESTGRKLRPVVSPALAHAG
jgi:hypothetical protein